MCRERLVSIVKRQQKRARCAVRRARDCEFVKREGSPSGAGQRGHLPSKDRAAHTSHAELERAADAVITENGWINQWGHIQVNTAHVTIAKMMPSNVALSVMLQARRYQIDICQSASV